jgi:type IX secretion system PorP/SprF family membrane protein
MKNFLPCLLWSLFISPAIFAQDIHFSQFSETPLLRNPALAGLFSGDLRIQGVYRNQWNSVTVPYQTGSLNAEYKLPVGHSDDYLTMGGEILYDKAGTVALTATHILPVINYHKSLSDQKNMYLSLGFMGGLVQRKIDRSKITTNNQFNGNDYDPSLPTGETFEGNGYSYFDGSAGMSFNSQIGQNQDDNIILGVAYHHFNKAPRISFYSSDKIEMIPKWVFSSAVRMGMNDYSYVTFHADYSQQGSSKEIIGGGLYSYKLDDPAGPHYVFHAGAFLRWKDAIIPVVKMEYKPITIALSYDVNMSELKTASQGRGGFELSISYQTYFDRYNTSKEAVRCPRF